jgi:hypothetical protein
MRRQESSSFLKKRTKKLLTVARSLRVPPETDKSFLVLFFKKELLPFLAHQHPGRACP